MTVLKVTKLIFGVSCIAIALSFLWYLNSYEHSSVLSSFVLVCLFTVALGGMTYNPMVLWKEYKFYRQQERVLFEQWRHLFFSQMALYALIAGVLLAIVAVLASSQSGDMFQHLKDALWTLLYGVMIATALWVLSGVVRPVGTQGNAQDSSSKSQNQMTLAFCVMLLTVGVLSMLFAKIFQLNYHDGSDREVKQVAFQPSGVDENSRWIMPKKVIPSDAPVSLLLNASHGVMQSAHATKRGGDVLRWVLPAELSPLPNP